MRALDRRACRYSALEILNRGFLKILTVGCVTSGLVLAQREMPQRQLSAPEGRSGPGQRGTQLGFIGSTQGDKKPIIRCLLQEKRLRSSPHPNARYELRKAMEVHLSFTFTTRRISSACALFSGMMRRPIPRLCNGQTMCYPVSPLSTQSQCPLSCHRRPP